MHGAKPRTYNGTMGTAVSKVFDLNAGRADILDSGIVPPILG